MKCPSCATGLLGAHVVTLKTRGTRTELNATVCPSCGTVSVPEHERGDLP